MDIESRKAGIVKDLLQENAISSADAEELLVGDVQYLGPYCSGGGAVLNVNQYEGFSHITILIAMGLSMGFGVFIGTLV